MTPTPASHLDHLCSAYVNRRYEGSHIPVEIYKQTGILACCGTYCCILSPYHTITFFTSKEKRTRKTPAVVAPPYRCASSSRQDDPSGLSLLAPCSHLSLSLSLPPCVCSKRLYQGSAYRSCQPRTFFRRGIRCTSAILHDISSPVTGRVRQWPKYFDFS